MNIRRGRGRITRKFRKSRGSAVVEFAVVAPVLFAIVFGVIEFGWRMMVRQTMVQASQVGARTASLPGSTDNQINAAVDKYLSAAGYGLSANDYSISLVHATTNDPSETVTISMPMANATLTGFFGTPTGYMTVSSVVAKEGQI